MTVASVAPAAAPVAPGMEQPQATTPAIIEQPTATPPAAAPEVIGDPAAPVVPDASQDDGAFSYAETGDAALDISLGFIGSMGLGPDHPAVKDAIDGKFDRLDATLAALGDKAAGYQRYLQLAKEAYTRTTQQAEQSQTTITTVVHEVAGSADAWAQVKTWAGQNADQSEKDAINAMLSAGPVQARAAAQMLTQAFRSAGGTVVEPANPTTQNAGQYSNTSNGALSPAEYGQAVRDLRGQLGSRFDNSPEYTALQARRSAWRG